MSAKVSKHTSQKKLETEPEGMDASLSQRQRQSEPEIVNESDLPDGEAAVPPRTPKEQRKRLTPKEQK